MMTTTGPAPSTGIELRDYSKQLDWIVRVLALKATAWREWDQGYINGNAKN